jgi:hypothetical protein
MQNGEHDRQIIDGVRKQLDLIFNNSTQSVYIYYDDAHKVCNKKFATLLGYSSPEEWSAVKENFPDAFVMKESQSTLITTYRTAVEKFVAATIKVNWKTKSGKPVETTTILVPMVYDEEAMALHYISETGK